MNAKNRTCEKKLHTKKKFASPTGFEPVREDPNGFLVHRLNHSATTTTIVMSTLNVYINMARAPCLSVCIISLPKSEPTFCTHLYWVFLFWFFFAPRTHFVIVLVRRTLHYNTTDNRRCLTCKSCSAEKKTSAVSHDSFLLWS